MNPDKNITLKKATYLKDCIYRFEFSDGVISDVDFKPFISYNESLHKFLDISKFSKMKYREDGDIWWGKDWDICFHIHTYYKETKVVPLSQKK